MRRRSQGPGQGTHSRMRPCRGAICAREASVWASLVGTYGPLRDSGPASCSLVWREAMHGSDSESTACVGRRQLLASGALQPSPWLASAPGWGPQPREEAFGVVLSRPDRRREARGRVSVRPWAFPVPPRRLGGASAKLAAEPLTGNQVQGGPKLVPLPGRVLGVEPRTLIS